MTRIVSSTPFHAVLIVVAGAGGAGGCIVHDTGIQIAVAGFDWCGQAFGAVAFDDLPDDGEDILVANLETPPTDDFPMECTCFTPHGDE